MPARMVGAWAWTPSGKPDRLTENVGFSVLSRVTVKLLTAPCGRVTTPGESAREKSGFSCAVASTVPHAVRRKNKVAARKKDLLMMCSSAGVGDARLTPGSRIARQKRSCAILTSLCRIEAGLKHGRTLRFRSSEESDPF